MKKLDFLAEDEGPKNLNVNLNDGKLKDLSESIRALVQIREEIDCLNEDLEKLMKTEAALSTTEIPEAMKSLGLKKFVTVATESTPEVEVSYREEISVSIPKDKEQIAFAFLKKIKADSIIKNFASIVFDRGRNDEAAKFYKAFKKAFPKLAPALDISAKIHPQTLKAAVKELQEKGTVFPEEGFNIFPYNKTIIKRKAG